MEWWDEFFLPPGTSEFPPKVTQDDVFVDRITNLVQHPVPVKSKKAIQDEKIAIPIHLTAEEKRKLSRRDRLAKE